MLYMHIIHKIYIYNLYIYICPNHEQDIYIYIYMAETQNIYIYVHPFHLLYVPTIYINR